MHDLARMRGYAGHTEYSGDCTASSAYSRLNIKQGRPRNGDGPNNNLDPSVFEYLLNLHYDARPFRIMLTQQLYDPTVVGAKSDTRVNSHIYLVRIDSPAAPCLPRIPLRVHPAC